MRAFDSNGNFLWSNATGDVRFITVDANNTLFYCDFNGINAADGLTGNFTVVLCNYR